MKKVKKAVCWICLDEYDSVAAAKKCEAKGFVTPYFKIGDTVTYQKYLGSDKDGPYHEKRIGKVLDILFPEPSFDSNGPALHHGYQVSYLVRTQKHESGDRFFDQEHIELLQTLRTVEVVREASMFFADGVRVGFYPDTPRSRRRRTVVAHWADYVADVVRRNPQLRDRLNAFTKKLRKLDCIE